MGNRIQLCKKSTAIGNITYLCPKGNAVGQVSGIVNSTLGQEAAGEAVTGLWSTVIFWLENEGKTRSLQGEGLVRADSNRDARTSARCLGTQPGPACTGPHGRGAAAVAAQQGKASILDHWEP